MDDVVYLVTESFAADAYGVQQRVLTERKVYCRVSSVGSREWFEGGRNGLNPEFQFIVIRFDYDGEKVLKYHDNYYFIYRTYINGDFIELYTERREGYDK